MSNLNDFLDGIEKLAYRVLLWGLIIPKTLLKIIFEPQWIPGYVKEQLHLDDAKPAFDKYISPVVLFIVVTLIPAVLLSFVPPVGITVLPPTSQSEGDLRNIVFTVRGDFRSSTTRVFHRVWWELYNVKHTDPSGNPAFITYGYDANRALRYVDAEGNTVDKPDFEFAFGQLQDERTGVHDLVKQGENIVPDLEKRLYSSELMILDGHTVEDYFYVKFVEGEYQIRVKMENYDSGTGEALETFEDKIYITVPADETKGIYFDSTYMVDSEDAIASSGNSGFSLEGLQAGLESGSIYFLALGLLSLPLLFSFGTKAPGPDGISETSMKESFYMQCYFFAPLSATIWAFIYTATFSTSDIALYMDLLLSLGIIFLMLLWFAAAETNAIMVERDVTRFKAWMIFLAPCAVLMIGAFFMYSVSFDPDILRRYPIILYPILGVLVFAGYVYRRFREWRKNRQKIVEVSPVSPAP